MVNTTTAMAIEAPASALEAIQVPSQGPGRAQVLVQVEASGVCNADLGLAAAKEPATGFPIVPGHEVAGTIAAIGADVAGWSVGDRVAVGWFGGSCGHCAFCRTGDPVHCAERRTPGVDYRGGWAETIVVPADALARIPEGLDFADAAPMGCAGVTVFNALRHAGVRAGGTVAVFGIGGLGHLAVSFSKALGYRTIAISRGDERKPQALELGAQSYIDSATEDVPAALQRLGGADLIISTASATDAVSGLVTGLRVGGRLTLVGVDGGRLTISAVQLVMNRQVVTGSLTGSPRDIEETMEFAVTNGIRPVIERMPLVQAEAALNKLRHGGVRFRIVLEPGAEG
ncbi:alcohol dehydrogenase catalytic domain-containing protein [Kribbella speibonae]|uniref:Alcohol dehydrogenase n=1 Tax=Kribbella speibonae TaxID=1572660 RepID=A0A4R0IXS6_9ACTN|nr:alcohol dehydrogenase catalytic domain-containing protein [Kribbella speibonae]TCC36378.1 alcohol dehydrogenase [Kribbella speibonae]